MDMYSLEYSPEWLSLLNKKLDQMRSDGDMCDVYLKGSNSETHLPVHSCIISAASPVIHNSLSKAFSKDISSTAVILNLEATTEALEAVVTFVYTGHLTCELEGLSDVINAATFLRMQNLLDMCQGKVVSSCAQIKTIPVPTNRDCRNASAASENKLQNCDTSYTSASNTTQWGAAELSNDDSESYPIIINDDGSIVDNYPVMLKDDGTVVENYSVVLKGDGTAVDFSTAVPTYPVVVEQIGDQQQYVETLVTTMPTEQYTQSLLGNVTADDENSLMFSDGSRPRLMQAALMKTSGEPVGAEESRSRYPRRLYFGKLVCKVCGKVFQKKWDLDTHMPVHTNIYAHNCHICGKKFKFKNSIRNHMLRRHSLPQESEFPCPDCKKVFHVKTDLEYHYIKKHSKEFSFCCDNCGKGFLHPKQYQIHLMKAHGKQIGDVDLGAHVCPYCTKGFPFMGNLSVHIKLKHTELFQCQQCMQTFRLKNMLKKHLYSEHGSEAKLAWCMKCQQTFHINDLPEHQHLYKYKPSTYPCPYPNCNFVGLHASSMRRHEEEHQVETVEPDSIGIVKIGEKKDPADNVAAIIKLSDAETAVQLATYNDNSSLGATADKGAADSDKKVFPCDQCRKKYRSQKLLFRHKQREHDNSVQFSCIVAGCTFQCKEFKGLLEHHNVHKLRNQTGQQNTIRPMTTSRGNYACPECRKRYESRYRLRVHVRTVHGERFQCPLCNQKFPLNEECQRHIYESHEGDGLGLGPAVVERFFFPCNHCKKGFATKTKARIHERTVHEKIIRFKCSFQDCDYGAYFRRAVELHEKKIHDATGYVASISKFEDEEDEEALETSAEVVMEQDSIPQLQDQNID